MKPAWTSIVVVLAQSAAVGATVSFQGLGELPGGSYYSSAAAVSPDGTVVVGSSMSGTSVIHAFRWEAGVMTGLGDLPGGSNYSTAQGVCAAGDVIVGQSNSADGAEAFIWTPATGMTALRAQPGVRDTFRANAITPAGDQIVGAGADGLGFHYAGGVLTSLPDLPGGSVNHAEATAVSADGSIIAGVGNQTEGEGEAMIWHNGVAIGLGDLPGGWLNSGVRALTPDGSYAVGYGSGSAGIEALRWQLDPGGGGAVAVDFLGNLPGSDHAAMATAVSADGSVVVGRDTFSPAMRAFLWTEADGMRDLKDVLETDYDLDLTDWLLISANAISADGLTIVGSGYHYGYGQEAFIVHIPEPSALALSLLLGLSVLRRRS